MNDPILKVSKYFFEFHFPNGFSYDIHKERCATKIQLDEWIEHLSHKVWWSSELENQFRKLHVTA